MCQRMGFLQKLPVKYLILLLPLMLLLLSPSRPLPARERSIAEQLKQIQTVFEQGVAFYNEQRYREAIAAFNAVIDLGGNEAIAHFNIANARYRLDDAGAAVVHYRRAIEAEPDFMQAYVNLGRLYYQLDSHGDAIVIFKRALAIEPDNAELYLLLGDCYLQAGSSSEAVYAYEQARELEPFNAAPYFGLAEAYMRIEAYENAVSVLEQAIPFVDTPAAVQRFLADMHYSTGQYEKAVTPLEYALFAEEDRFTYFRLAEVYRRLNQPFMAIDVLQASLEFDPDFTDAALFLGEIYMSLELFGNAAEVLLKTAEDRPRRARPYIHNLAIRLYNNRRNEDLRELCLAALRIYPGDDGFADLLSQVE